MASLRERQGMKLSLDCVCQASGPSGSLRSWQLSASGASAKAAASSSTKKEPVPVMTEKEEEEFEVAEQQMLTSWSRQTTEATESDLYEDSKTDYCLLLRSMTTMRPGLSPRPQVETGFTDFAREEPEKEEEPSLEAKMAAYWARKEQKKKEREARKKARENGGEDLRQRYGTEMRKESDSKRGRNSSDYRSNRSRGGMSSRVSSQPSSSAMSCISIASSRDDTTSLASFFGSDELATAQCRRVSFGAEERIVFAVDVVDDEDSRSVDDAEQEVSMPPLSPSDQEFVRGVDLRIEAEAQEANASIRRGGYIHHLGLEIKELSLESSRLWKRRRN